MEYPYRSVSKGAQHRQTAQPENNLLADSITIVSAVKMIRQHPVAGVIFLQVRIEEEDRNLVAIKALEFIFPCGYAHLASFDGDAHARRQQLEIGFGRPLGMRFDLVSVGIQPLLKIALSVEQRYAHHRNTQISGRPE